MLCVCVCLCVHIHKNKFCTITELDLNVILVYTDKYIEQVLTHRHGTGSVLITELDLCIRPLKRILCPSILMWSKENMPNLASVFCKIRRTHTHAHTHTHTHTCTRAGTHTHMCVRVFTRTHAHAKKLLITCIFHM